MAQQKRQNYMASKLALDMKALALLHPSDVELREIVRDSLVESHDEQVNRVLDSLRTLKPPRRENNVLIAIGELVLASFLMAGGVIAIAPFLAGVTTPTTLVLYFGRSLRDAATSPSFFPVLPELVILLSVVLLMSALYALRKASTALKEEGFANR